MASYSAHSIKILPTLALLSLVLTSGCSTVVEGRSQKITVTSTPAGAECIFKQADDVVGHVTTPGTAEVAKTKNDLVILCSKSGYESVSINNHSDYSLASMGNMVLGQYSFIGNAVDSVSGASNKYDSKVAVTLLPAATPAAFPAPPGAPPIVQMAPQIATAMSMQVPMPANAALQVPVQEPTPQPALPAATTAAATNASPSINASVALAKAAVKMQAQLQPAPQSYAEALAESPRRPPFDTDQ